ncbi:unnamed protein product, partial [Ixodes pacificus]
VLSLTAAVLSVVSHIGHHITSVCALSANHGRSGRDPLSPLFLFDLPKRLRASGLGRERNARAQSKPSAVRVSALDGSFSFQFGGMAAVYGHYCAAKWCQNTTKTADCSFFRFATDDRASKWIYYANRPEFKLLPLSKLRERRLCGEHFAASAFRSSRKTRLRENACPSVLVTNTVSEALVSPCEPVSKCLIRVCR